MNKPRPKVFGWSPLTSLYKNLQKYEQTRITNKPRIRTNPKVSKWALLASLVPQKQQTKSKIRINPNFEQTQNLNKPKSFRISSARFARSAKTTNQILKNTIKPKLRTNPKIANRVSSVRSAETSPN